MSLNPKNEMGLFPGLVESRQERVHICLNLLFTEVIVAANGQPKYEKRLPNDTASDYSSNTNRMRHEDVRLNKIPLS